MVFVMQQLLNQGVKAVQLIPLKSAQLFPVSAEKPTFPQHTPSSSVSSWTGLRFKVISIVAGSFIVLFLTQFAVVRTILLRDFTKLEENRALVNADRLQNAFSTEISRLSDAARDYSTWDETYQFVTGNNPEYFKAQLYDSAFASIKVNLAAVANRQKVLALKGRDFYRQQNLQAPEEFQRFIALQAKGKGLKYGKEGFLQTSAGPLLVTSQPVLRSNKTGSGIAVLGMGRFIDPQMLEKLSAATQLSVQSHPYQGSALQGVPATALQDLQVADTATAILDEHTISSYVRVNDVFGKPILILKADNNRQIYTFGLSSINYYFWSTLLIGLAFCALVLGLLERFVLSRLSRLGQGLDQIGSQGCLSARVYLPGRDELSQLAATVNHTLEQLGQAQQSLQDSEARYALAVKGAKDGIWDWNLLTDEAYFSERWKNIFGYEEQELSSSLSGWFKHLHPQDLQSFKRSIEAHLQGQTPYLEHEHRILHRDGTERWVLCRGSAVRDSSGTPSRMAGSLTDVSDRKAADLVLARQSEELARSNQELEQFAYIASHDLQEPLRKIETFGDRLKQKHGQTLEPQALDYLARMQNAAGRMRLLIQDLLAFSRVTSQSHELTPVSLSEVLEGVLGDLEVKIQETQAQIAVGPLPTLKADALQMRQIFQNLISNALKFQQPGRTPAITISCKDLPDCVQVGGQPNQPMCQVSVTDNGIGFDEKYLDRIFKVFQRLHGRSEYEGTGIGLAVCAKIVERHSGHLTARSSPGEGATFMISLPL